MKHGEKITPVAAALAAITTVACCLPMGFTAAILSATLAAAIAAYQSWFLGASIVLLVIGAWQYVHSRRSCSKPRTAATVILAGAMMKPRRVAVGLMLLVLAAFGWWRFGTRIAPAGQPPLLTLDHLALTALRDDFNRASPEMRIIALLSPT
jgi:hypothetical protein